ncbi:MAG: hypothetical protein PHG48_03795 [Eubacteriales bacterium]|jgi:hypothetical protein|nr:hypothetical protein [Eubacteriales bacterium]
MPAGPDNDGNTYMYKTSSQHYFAFPSNLKEPEAVLGAFVQWQLLWDEARDKYVTYEDMIRGTAIIHQYPEDVENYIRIFTSKDKVKDEYIDHFPAANTLIGIKVFGQIGADNSVTAYSAIEAISSEVKAIIDDAMRR